MDGLQGSTGLRRYLSGYYVSSTRYAAGRTLVCYNDLDMKEVKELAEPDKKFLITMARTIDNLMAVVRGVDKRMTDIEGKLKPTTPEVIVPQVAIGAQYPNMYILFGTSEEMNRHEAETNTLKAAVNTFCATTGVKQIWVSYISK